MKNPPSARRAPGELKDTAAAAPSDVTGDATGDTTGETAVGAVKSNGGDGSGGGTMG
jgi:hypothetical protein